MLSDFGISEVVDLFEDAIDYVPEMRVADEGGLGLSDFVLFEDAQVFLIVHGVPGFGEELMKLVFSDQPLSVRVHVIDFLADGEGVYVVIHHRVLVLAQEVEQGLLANAVLTSGVFGQGLELLSSDLSVILLVRVVQLLFEVSNFPLLEDVAEAFQDFLVGLDAHGEMDVGLAAVLEVLPHRLPADVDLGLATLLEFFLNFVEMLGLDVLLELDV